MSTIRRAFLTGLLVLAPLGITAWVFTWIFRSIDGLMRPWLLRAIPQLRGSIPEEGFTGIGFVAAILIVVLVGIFANNLLGRAFFGAIDRVVGRIPWVKGVYSATKEISGVVFTERGQAFRKVVLFEYPRPGLYSLGFVTRESQSDLPHDVYNVFLPTTPNPTSGYFLMVPREDAIPLSISIEDGLKLIVSGGAVISPANRQLIEQALARLQKR
jgi:uncharacterized membrane protein